MKRGDRVRLSKEGVQNLGLKSARHAKRLGTIVGYSNDRKFFTVQWDGNYSKSPPTHPDLLEKAPDDADASSDRPAT